jgi:GNAT superfamily N-acetyltransferase
MSELRLFIKNTIQKQLNENVLNTVKYKKSVDDNTTHINAYINNEKIGSLTMEILYDSYNYEFDDVFDEEEFEDLFPESEIVKIEYLNVEDKYKNSGVGSELMKRGMILMRKNGYTQFYLNASPMGMSGLNTNELVNFYKKFGFKEILNQGHNVLMSVTY